MKKITRIASIFLSLALIFAAAACGKDGSGAALSYPIAAQPDCLDPQIAQGAEAKTVVLNCFEGLVRKDAEGKYSPAAATSWSYDASSLTYTFKLREDARWVIMKKAFKPILGDNIDFRLPRHGGGFCLCTQARGSPRNGCARSAEPRRHKERKEHNKRQDVLRQTRRAGGRQL